MANEEIVKTATKTDIVATATAAIEKLPRYWMRGANGKRSASLTLAVVAFVICTIWVAASMFEQIGPVKIRVFDPAVAGVYLIPILGLYWGRRKTESDSKVSTAAIDAAKAGE